MASIAWRLVWMLLFTIAEVVGDAVSRQRFLQGQRGSRLMAGPGNSTPQTIGRFRCLLPLLSLASDSEKQSPHECTRTAGGERHHMTLSQLTYNLTSIDMVRLAVNLQGLQSLSTSDRTSVKNIPPFEMMDTGKTISISWCRRVTYRA